jgi:hypothetical protein
MCGPVWRFESYKLQEAAFDGFLLTADHNIGNGERPVSPKISADKQAGIPTDAGWDIDCGRGAYCDRCVVCAHSVLGLPRGFTREYD